MEPIVEFVKKYHGTYIRVKMDDKVQVAMVSAAAGTTIALDVVNLGMISLRYPEGLAQCNLMPPEVGYFNYKGSALYLFRTPARQWRRGLCPDNHEIYNPLRVILPKYASKLYRPQWGWRLAEGLYARDFATNLNEALQKLQRYDFISCAISSKIAVSKAPRKGIDALLWYKTIPVGIIIGTSMKIEDETYRQEIIDEFRQNGELNKWTF